LSATKLRPDVSSDPLEHLRLDPKEDHVGVADRVGIRGDGADPVLALERFPALSARVAGDDAIGRDPEPTVAIVALERGGTAGV